MSADSTPPSRGFDPEAKEAALREESESWDTSVTEPARPGDIPVIDLTDYFAPDSSAQRLADVADQLRDACETVGFWQLVGHGLSPSLIDETFAAVRAFHDLPLEVKEQIRMDRPGHPLGGVGYLPVKERKLPSRSKGNLNEAFLMKRSRTIGDDDNQWVSDEHLPGFKAAVLSYADAVEGLALRLLPIYATALGMEPTFFDEGFTHPFWRLRMTHYPPDEALRTAPDEFGIAPHVDTTFFTLLLQQSAGLCIYSHRRECWIEAPLVENAFVVNSGELLKQWTNDRFLSVRHFANNPSANNPSAINSSANNSSANNSSANNLNEPRYSIPFFFNANGDYPMHTVPT